MPHRPPEPHYCCTIPSIHDDIPLNCRIYHPDAISKPEPQAGAVDRQWRKRGIVMAHPYAPMGGSYDDRVVGIVVEAFLGLGYVVGTFNFRGAQGAKGRTSWSGKAEVQDYISFAAFFTHYMTYLRANPSPDTSFAPEQSPISPVNDNADRLTRVDDGESPVVILGGYSYGSLILRHLPPVPSILHPFSAPLPGSSASEIVLRARKLAEQSNLEFINVARDAERSKRRGHENKLSVAMGGEETNPDQRRSSREIRRSMDERDRKSVDIGGRLRSWSHRRAKEDPFARPGYSSEKDGAGSRMQTAIPMPHVRYLLVSPLTPPVSTLVAPGLAHKPWSKSNEQEVVGKHVALAVYGDQDIFTSSKKVRQWAEKLSSAAGSRFENVEIEGCGHFWHEEGVVEKLRTALKEWEGRVRE